VISTARFVLNLVNLTQVKFLDRLLRRQRVVLLFLDLIQDLDLLVPIAVGIQQSCDLRLKVVATGRVLEKSPRIQTTFSDLGIEVHSVFYKAVLKDALPTLQGVAALITASETTAGPHRAAHALAKRANRMGVASYTLQHGYENIGLNYADEVYPFDKIQFASQHVFIWGDPAQLPAAVAAETRAKCIQVGCPKYAQPTQTLPQLDHGREYLVAIFENLHWERYSDDYRQRALRDIQTTAEQFPQVTFLIKPHHAGMWLTKQDQKILPECDNIWVIDPREKQWQAYTAPAFLAVADAAISTPSTVVLDAARLGKPTAVVGYDLALPYYEQLPVLRETDDWSAFVKAVMAGRSDDKKAHSEHSGSAPFEAIAISQKSQTFVEQQLLPGDSVARILNRVRLDIAR